MDLQLIQNQIREIRGYKVILDFDLAEMYGVETKRLKETVRRNIERFEGDDFMFQLTRDEIIELSRTQFATLKRGNNIKYAPFAFTELGVAMLSSVLNSSVAIETNRAIMRAFVFVRHLIINPPVDRVTELQKEFENLKIYMEDVFSDYNDINEDTRTQLELINKSLAELHVQQIVNEKPRRPIGFIIQEKD